MADEFCLKMPDFHITFRDLLNLRHGTNGFTSLPKKGVLRIFSPWKIRLPQPGLNPRIWVPKANTLPLDHRSRVSGVSCIIVSTLGRETVAQSSIVSENAGCRACEEVFMLNKELSNVICFNVCVMKKVTKFFVKENTVTVLPCNWTLYRIAKTFLVSSVLDRN